MAVTPKTEQDVFKGVPGYYVDTRTVWIDPVTGTIVKGNEHQVRSFRGGDLDGKTAVDLNLTFDDATVKYQTHKAKDGRKQIALASFWLPLVSLIVGALALVGAVLLLGRRDREPPDEADASQSQPDPEQGPPGFAPPQQPVPANVTSPGGSAGDSRPLPP